MSILLALLRSPRSSGTLRSRRIHGTNEIYTEMGVFSRSNAEETELLELPTVVFPTPTASEDPNLTSLNLLKSDAVVDENGLTLASSFRMTAPAEVAFVYECLSLGATICSDVLIHEAFERLCWSGSLLCNLLCSALPGSLDERAINITDGGIGNLSVNDVLENFHLCRSCAHAQGCDVQGLTVERLHACEVSCTTDFVLEVLRVSVMQALPASDRHVLVGPPSQASRIAAAPNGTFPSKGRLANSPLPELRDGQAHGGRQDFGVEPSGSRVNSSGGDDGASTGAEAQDRVSSSIVYPPLSSLQLGTAASRRAMSGLELWVLQLVAPRPAKPASPYMTVLSAPGTPDMGTCTSFTLPVVERPPMQLSPGPATECAAADGLDVLPLDTVPSGHWGCNSTLGLGWGSLNSIGRPREGTGLGCGTDVSLALPSELDPLGLEVWERLSELLTQPLSSSHVRGEASPAPGEGTQNGLNQRSSYLEAVFEDLGAAPDSSMTVAGSQMAMPRGCDEDLRWAAVAQAISRALAATPCQGPPLPSLRAEHLQSRHSGLRALVLARALLTHCHRRDRLKVMEAADNALGISSSSGSCSGSLYQEDKGDDVSPSATEADAEQDSAAAVAAVIAAAATKMLPASPAPPLPQRRELLSSSSCAPVTRRQRSISGPPPMDVLSEHNLLVQQEHHQRELRRQQRQQQQQRSAGGGRDTGGSWAASNVAGTAEVKGLLWNGDGDDDEGADQEERVLRLWLNSLDPGIHVTSLFEQEITTGWTLLLALDAIQPGCVPWSEAFRPPFKEKLRKILSVQNCNLVIEVCTRQLAMPPLVNIGGLDLALGQRRATLSLVFQMMRHHMGMLLGLAAPSPPPSPHSTSTMPSATNAQQQPGHGLVHSYSLGHTCRQNHSHGSGNCFGHDMSPHMALHVPYAPSPQRGTRAHVEVEKAVLAWANAKLKEAAEAAAAAGAGSTSESVEVASVLTPFPGAAVGVVPQLPFTPLTSFSDKRLGKGCVLLQLLAAICPRSINPKYVLPGRNAEERGSNARYLLSCARKLGCVIFLAWEDVVAARPNLLLLLLASFMALDRKRVSATSLAAVSMTTAACVTREVSVGLTTPSALMTPSL